MNTVVTDPFPSGRTSPESLPVSAQSSGAPRRGLNPSDVAQAEVAFTRALADLPHELRRAGVQLFARLASPNWQMEWGLPRWLAESRGLPESTCARLVAANVLGLGYVRLADDCKDGQAGPLGPEATMRLASAVYDEAISIYAELIGPHAWFWKQFDRFLDEWRAAGIGILPVDVLHATRTEIRSLKLLGAPLQICVAAVCAMAGEEDQLDSLASPVGSYLVASVLLDHMSDWSDDLGGGRPNLFVRAILGELLPGSPIEDARRKMAEAMLRPERLVTYLDLVSGELHDAISASRRERLDDLAEYLCLLRQETQLAADHLVGEIRALLRQAVALVFAS